MGQKEKPTIDTIKMVDNLNLLEAMILVGRSGLDQVIQNRIKLPVTESHGG